MVSFAAKKTLYFIPELLIAGFISNSKPLRLINFNSLGFIRVYSLKSLIVSLKSFDKKVVSSSAWHLRVTIGN